MRPTTRRKNLTRARLGLPACQHERRAGAKSHRPSGHHALSNAQPEADCDCPPIAAIASSVVRTALAIIRKLSNAAW